MTVSVSDAYELTFSAWKRSQPVVAFHPGLKKAAIYRSLIVPSYYTFINGAKISVLNEIVGAR